MIIKSVNLDIVCGITSKLPENTLPEIAFAGKSNVGKSSLINALMNRKNYARTSQSPGKTQTINYYNINQELFFVDLPGYGYARPKEHLKSKGSKRTKDSLPHCKQIKLVMLLIDIRHKPSDNDCLMYRWICDHGYKPVIIATKSDKINRSQLNKQLQMIANELQVLPETIIIPFSALNKQGREDIYELLDMTLGKEA